VPADTDVAQLSPPSSFESNATVNDGDQSITVSRLLSEAQNDISEKRLKKPDSNNAFNKLNRVLQIEPQNAQAKAGMEQIAEEYVKLADAAIKSRQLKLADAYLNDAMSASPGLDLIETIRTKLKIENQSKIDQIATIDMQGESLQIQGLLGSAAIDMDEGRLNSPNGDNAKEKYLKVLELSPKNKQALSGLENIKKMLAEKN
jgi:hypothetical protein